MPTMQHVLRAAGAALLLAATMAHAEARAAAAGGVGAITRPAASPARLAAEAQPDDAAPERRGVRGGLIPPDPDDRRGVRKGLIPPDPESGWPVELGRRPLTLTRGMLEVRLPLGLGLSRQRFGEPTFLAPSVAYGVTERLTVGVSHAQGLCLTGASHACPRTYGDVAVDALWRLLHSPIADVAVGLTLAASPVADPFAVAGAARLVARIGGPVAFAVAPALRVGFTERDSGAAAFVPVAIPLATYGYGGYESFGGNHQYLSLPASVTYQLAPTVAGSVGASVDGPLDGDFFDDYRVPVGAAVTYTPVHQLDLGASFTFGNLLGRQRGAVDRWDDRGLQLFAAWRP